MCEGSKGWCLVSTQTFVLRLYDLLNDDAGTKGDGKARGEPKVALGEFDEEFLGGGHDNAGQATLCFSRTTGLLVSRDLASSILCSIHDTKRLSVQLEHHTNLVTCTGFDDAIDPSSKTTGCNRPFKESIQHTLITSSFDGTIAILHLGYGSENTPRRTKNGTIVGHLPLTHLRMHQVLAEATSSQTPFKVKGDWMVSCVNTVDFVLWKRVWDAPTPAGGEDESTVMRGWKWIRWAVVGRHHKEVVIDLDFEVSGYMSSSGTMREKIVLVASGIHSITCLVSTIPLTQGWNRTQESRTPMQIDSQGDALEDNIFSQDFFEWSQVSESPGRCSVRLLPIRQQYNTREKNSVSFAPLFAVASNDGVFIYKTLTLQRISTLTLPWKDGSGEAGRRSEKFSSRFLLDVDEETGLMVVGCKDGWLGVYQLY
ncbi:hypothetical protein HDV05_005023 [Chytridiales sp. JEL 0842]|nr:hypothetical protein HDV05_005023 [Chytridiales sp. JEL 0842]